MTKWRAPLTIDAALSRIAGQLPAGWRDMAAQTARKERTVRNWGDPDTPEQIPMDAAIALDLAFQAAGGKGAPIFEVYATRLEAAGVARFADRIELGLLAPQLIRECAEAEIAIVTAAQPGATDADRRAASREVREAIEVLGRAQLMVGNADRPGARREGDADQQPP